MYELEPRDPRGCSAIIESERLASGSDFVIDEVLFDCSRKCNIVERKELVGSHTKIDQDITSFIRSIVDYRCQNLEELRDSSMDIPTGFLPPIIEL